MKAAIYVRTATASQDEGMSVLTQRQLAEKYCAEHGIEIHQVYIDEGVSGLQAFEQRAAGGRLLTDARNGEFELVVVYGMDRLARDRAIAGGVVHELKSFGITVQSISEAFRISTEIEKLLGTM